MADIQVRIKLNAGVSGDEIQSVDFNQETNNVSKSIGSKTTQNAGQNLISWGEDGLVHIDEDGYVGGASATLGKQGGYNGFVFGVVPKNKEYSVEVTLEGSNIDSVTFYGDKTANQFPTRAIVNGKYIYSDDAEWTIIFPSASNTQTITFDMWNRGDYNACFTHIGVLVNELVLDKKWIKSVEILSQSSGQPQNIHYYITPSVGNLELIDVNGELRDYIEDGILPSSNVPVAIIANDRTVIKQVMDVKGYDNENKIISSTLSPKTINNLDTVINRITPTVMTKDNLSTHEHLTAFWVLSTIFKKYLGYSDEDFDNLFLDGDGNERLMVMSRQTQISIKEYLLSIKFRYFIPYQKTARQFITEMLQLAKLQLIENSNGKYSIVSARPRKSLDEKVIEVNKKYIFSTFDYDLIVKNNYHVINQELTNILYSRADVYKNHIEVLDNNNNLKIGDYFEDFKIVIINNVPYFAFFLEIESSNPIIDMYSSAKAIFNLTVTTPNGTETQIYQTTILHDDENTKNTYQFNNDLRRAVLLTKESTRDKFVIAMLVYNGSTTRSFDITINAKQYSLIQEKKSQSINNYESITSRLSTGETVNFPNNDYLTNATVIDTSITGSGFPLYEANAQEILRDYADGVKTARVTISCNDYYYTNGELAKDWSKGEIIQVHDLVKVDGNDLTWRVTGRNFRKTGVPMIDLELQEVIED